MMCIALYHRIMIGYQSRCAIQCNKQGAYQCGYVTFIALTVMITLLSMGIMMMKLTTMSLSNTVDEMRLIRSHYCAERGARWFAIYCAKGNVGNFTEPLIIEDNSSAKLYIRESSIREEPRHIMSYGIVEGVASRVHIYIKEENNKFFIVHIKPY